MENKNYYALFEKSNNRSFMYFIFSGTLSLLLLVLNQKTAKAQSSVEKKVDYLERIYFSGENKEGLNTKILIALQEIQEKTPTPALAKQATFLLDIQDKTSAADNACDILDLLAVGIYNIDAAEAVKQGVKAPSDKAKAKSVDALASLNKLNSTSNNLSSSARNLEWSSYMLSGGKYGSFASGAGKVARTAGTVGYAAGAAGQAAQTAKQLGDVGKSLGINFKKKDKACNDVEKKDIEIGEHLALPVSTNTNTSSNANTKANPNATTSTTIINIQGISSSSLRALTDTLRNKAGIQSAEKSYNEVLSTITVMHAGSTDALADWIEDKFSSKLKLADYGNGKINLITKK